ncbi:acyloxyacyl hydrolase [Rhizobium halophytocola]|uniref:Acyloxyacyl hydrolase n=1 Tax=Rhizobium halophytocola TaxID=735519 RepID=A0ABS4DZB7_9HYPH|nr:acyloxyacyl hydrolase [Rhizobium halophytocola]MBP1851033.1 hypothetical protein [Rhizobium halophytocola]
MRTAEFATAGAALLLFLQAGTCNAADWSVKEIRTGLSASIQDGRSQETGLFPNITFFFDPFDAMDATTPLDLLLHPRVNVGAILSTSGETNLAFGGVDWKIPVTDKLYLDLGFGGAVHDGTLTGNTDGPNLGCHLLFHESVAAGYRITDRFDLVASVDHSSHAELCDGPNDGVSHAGLAVAYHF